MLSRDTMSLEASYCVNDSLVAASWSVDGDGVRIQHAIGVPAGDSTRSWGVRVKAKQYRVGDAVRPTATVIMDFPGQRFTSAVTVYDSADVTRIVLNNAWTPGDSVVLYVGTRGAVQPSLWDGGYPIQERPVLCASDTNVLRVRGDSLTTTQRGVAYLIGTFGVLRDSVLIEVR